MVRRGFLSGGPLSAMYTSQRTLRYADGPHEVHHHVVARAEVRAFEQSNSRPPSKRPWRPSTARSVGIAPLTLAANAGHKDQLETLVETTRSKIGPIDILIGNAGANPYYGVTSKIPDEAYKKTMKTNVQANLWLAQLVAPDMIAKGAGSMAFTSSIGAFKPPELLGTYGMSKLALIGLVHTEFERELWDNPQVEDRIKSDIPLRRLSEAGDFKGLAVFLDSDVRR